MARDIGPETLADLERDVAEGRIDQATFDSRRAEAMEAIRKSQALGLSRTEKVVWGGVAGLIAVLGAMLLIGGVTAGNWLSIAIAVLMIGFGINRFGYIRQH